jgi:protoheme IX farnesyltransferase
MVSAYVESLKLRVGTFIGLAAVLGYLATLPTAPSSGAPALPAVILLFAATVIAAGGAGALNHVLDRDLDARMPRTARRPLPSGRIRHVWHVVALGLGLVGIGVSLAFWRLNPLVAVHVFLGAFTYVVVYTVWLKRRSWLNVVVGGLAGSFAVLAGGSAARPELCLPPVLFALVLFFWSPSHFWSLAIAYKQDYAGARIPMLPVVKGERGAVRGILLNTAGLLAASVLPFFLGILGWAYLLVGVLLGGGLLVRQNLALAAHPTDRKRALANFHASNLYLVLLFVGVLADAAARRW